MRNIILIGPMGAGKTTIGRQLAKQLNMRFVDSDKEIETHTGASINLIFEIEGEAKFRERETKMLKKLSGEENVVLATGGGAVLAEENRKLLRRNGTVVYLRASVDTQLERTRKNKKRPLLHTDDPRARLEELMKVREPLYRQEADLIINADRRSSTRVAKDIIDQITNSNPDGA